jgi:hypothetical protein
MRRSLQLCRLGLAGAAAAVVLTACGGSGGTSAASSSTHATTSGARATSSAPAAVAGGDFCAQARTFAAEVASAGGIGGPNATAAQALQQAATQLQTIHPPAQIATDWQTAVKDIQQLAQAFATLNPSDQQQAAQLEQQVAPVEQELTAAGDRIEQYLQTTCGITAAPTS